MQALRQDRENGRYRNSLHRKVWSTTFALSHVPRHESLSRMCVIGFPRDPLPQEEQLFPSSDLKFGMRHSPVSLANTPAKIHSWTTSFQIVHSANTLSGSSGSLVVSLAGEIGFCGMHTAGKTDCGNVCFEFMVYFGDAIEREELDTSFQVIHEKATL